MNKLVAVLSIIGSLITVATFVSDVKGKPIAAWGRGPRGIIAVLLTLLGVGSWFAVPHPSASQAAMTTPVISSPAAQPATSTIVVELPAIVAPAPAPKPHARASAITRNGERSTTSWTRMAISGGS